MAQDGFFDSLPKHREFADLADPGAFTPLPADWSLCCSDIVDSTALIGQGRYKTVNMIGASVIAAMINALEGEAFPYVFGGDGASFAVPPHHAGTARDVLARLRSWVQSEAGIELRAAMLPVSWIRAEGLDVQVARYAASGDADYAMFSGGGLAWAEQQMKAGAFEVMPAARAAPPDLSGLSCRWRNMPARNGIILSLVVLPAPEAAAGDFARVVSEVLALASRLDRNGHPLPAEGPGMQFSPAALADEARISRGTAPLLLRKLQLLGGAALALLLFWRGKKTGQFDPARYREVLSANADFRKFDDGLKMTLDCAPEIRDRIAAVLEEARAAGQVRYGLHEQDEAVITCIVPSVLRDDHVHFVDGAAGGYTRAAAQLSGSEERVVRPA
ncbi:DUF3095 domain-containing protein [Roseobacteraceae bacterium NS-SX3]